MLLEERFQAVGPYGCVMTSCVHIAARAKEFWREVRNFSVDFINALDAPANLFIHRTPQRLAHASPEKCPA